jgi:hypothetical protein
MHEQANEVCGEPATAFSPGPDASVAPRRDAGRKEVVMGIVKVHRYGVRANRTDAQSLTLEAPGKPALRIATPPEFRNGVRGAWSPEERSESGEEEQ